MSFKNKLAQYYAQEGLEQTPPVEPPADVTIPEGGETQQGQDNGEEQGSTASAEQPGQEPTEPALDGEPGRSDALGDGAAGDDNDDDEDDTSDDPDVRPEFPDIDELNVNFVAKVEAAEDAIAQQAEAQRESVDQAVAESKNLVAAIEGFIEMARNGYAIGPATGRLSQKHLAELRARVGFADAAKTFALEEATASRSTTHVALEGYRNTLKTILETILRVLRAAIAWLVKYVKKNMVNIRAAAGQSLKLTEALLAHRKEKGVEEVLAQMSAADANVAFDAGVSTSAMARVLKIDGQQPNDYAQAFLDVLEVVETHKRYGEIFNDRFVEQIRSIFDVIEGKVDVDQFDAGKALTASMTGVLSKSMVLVDPKDLRDVRLPAKVVPPFKGFHTGKLLGNSDFFHFFPKTISEANAVDALETMSDWHFQRVTQASTQNDTGALRWLTTNELKAAAEVMGRLQRELVAQEQTVDQLLGVNEKLEALARQAAAKLAPLQGTESFFEASNEENGWKGELITLTVAALNNVVANTNAAMFETQRYGFGLSISWNAYLKGMLDGERTLVGRARMNKPEQQP